MTAWSLRSPAESLGSAVRITRVMRTALRVTGLANLRWAEQGLRPYARGARYPEQLDDGWQAPRPSLAKHNDHYVSSAGELRSAMRGAV
jgi:hypothetical protein